MLRSSCTSLLLLLYFSITAQTTVLTGKVLDKAAATPKQTVTDTAGNYSLNDLARGRYLLITSCVGYRKDSTNVDLSRRAGSGYSLDILLLHQGASLGAVEVNAKKRAIVFERGKLIFDVKQTSFTTGSNAWELLPKSPGVETQGSSISILGKEGTAVLIIGTRKYADISFRKSLWQKRASLVLTVSDIFHSNKWVYNIDYQDQHSGYTYIGDSRFARLSFTYKFGRTTIKAPKKVQTGIESEKSRL